MKIPVENVTNLSYQICIEKQLVKINFYGDYQNNGVFTSNTECKHSTSKSVTLTEKVSLAKISKCLHQN